MLLYQFYLSIQLSLAKIFKAMTDFMVYISYEEYHQKTANGKICTSALIMFHKLGFMKCNKMLRYLIRPLTTLPVTPDTSCSVADWGALR